MQHASLISTLSPETIREALQGHLARKLGWSGRTVTHILKPLSNDQICRCLAADPAETRAALFTRIAEVLGDATDAMAA